MKLTRINKGKVGMVFKRGNYERMLLEGTYWTFLSETVTVFDLREELFAGDSLELYLQHTDLAKALDVITVLDNELVLMYDDEIFKTILLTGKHAFWKSELNKYSFIKVDTNDIEIDERINPSLLVKAPLFHYIRTFNVASSEKGVLLVDNKPMKLLNSGTYYFWKNSQSVSVETVDLRQVQLEISGQEILTSDKTPLRINYSAHYKVVDAEKALLENKNFEKQLYVLFQLALRSFVGALTLDELLADKSHVEVKVMERVKVQAEKLGVEVSESGIRDLILPGNIKEIMNQVLIAQKSAQANVISRREETAATRSLLNTARLMEDNKMLFRLKEMEYVEKIAEKIGEISVSGNANIVDQLKTVFIK